MFFAASNFRAFLAEACPASMCCCSYVFWMAVELVSFGLPPLLAYYAVIGVMSQFNFHICHCFPLCRVNFITPTVIPFGDYPASGILFDKVATSYCLLFLLS